MSYVVLGWCLLLINQIFSSKYLPGHTLFLVNLCWGGPTCYEGCNFVAAIQTPLKWIDVQRCSINFMLRLKANEKEEVNKNRIWHKNGRNMTVKKQFWTVFALIAKCINWTWTTKILNRAGKSKTTGIPTSSGCKSPKDNWWTMWTIGPLLPGQATGAQNPNCPPLTYSPPKKSSTNPKKLAKVVHKHHFTPATASKSLPTRFIALAHAMPCWPKWVTIQYWCKMMQ